MVDMDLFNSPSEMMALASTLLLFLLSTNNVVNVPAPMDSDNDTENPFQSTMEVPPESSFDIEFVIALPSIISDCAVCSLC